MRPVALFLLLLACKGKEAPPGEETDPPDTDVGDDDDDVVPITFQAHEVDPAATGVRHATLADLDGDGDLEIIASLSGTITEADVPPGRVVYYDHDDSLDAWVRTEVVPAASGMRSPNEPLPHDVDGDGDLDLIVPFGSPFCDPVPEVEWCGGISWLQNNGSGWSRKEITDGNLLIYNAVALADLDNDGILDLVASGEDLAIGSALSLTAWFRGTGSGYEAPPVPIGAGGGPWPVIYDVDGDGDEDIVTGERNGGSTFVWFEQVAAPVGGVGDWERRILDDSNGDGWMMQFVPDLIGDGQTIAIGTNHTNTAREEYADTEESAVFVYTPGADVRQPWTATPITSGIEAVQDVALFPMDAPGIFSVGDIDLDGDLDIALAGDGDPRFYVLDQVEPGNFETRVLSGNIPRNGGAALGDIDDDGDLEIVVTAQIANSVHVIEVVFPE